MGGATARAPVMPRLVLATAAVLFAAFGIAFAVAPHRLAAMVDLPLPTTTATADFVATYGGFEIGFAVFLFTCLARPERVRLGLLASGCAVAGFAIARARGDARARGREAGAVLRAGVRNRLRQPRVRGRDARGAGAGLTCRPAAAASASCGRRTPRR